MQIVIIGSGNVATVLGKKISLAGHDVLQVYSRNEKHAAELAKALNVAWISDHRKINPQADIYVVAISDNGLSQIGNWLQLGRKLVVHTAASLSKDTLMPVSRNYGVLYPLQSLRKQMMRLPEIPFLVDGNTKEDLTIIYDFAKTFSSTVKHAGDAERLSIHIAAVVAGNFTNHLYALVEDYCREKGGDFNLLFPLITEVADRLKDGSPLKMQTGPAIRNDDETIKRHLAALDNFPALKTVYRQLTDSIIKFSKQTEDSP